MLCCATNGPLTQHDESVVRRVRISSGAPDLTRHAKTRRFRARSGMKRGAASGSTATIGWKGVLELYQVNNDIRVPGFILPGAILKPLFFDENETENFLDSLS